MADNSVGKHEQEKSNCNTEVSVLVLVVIIGTLLAWVLPHISYLNTVHLKYSNISLTQTVTLASLAALSVIYLAYFRTKHYFSTRWLVAATTYNFLILFVKFTLSTNEFPDNGTYTLTKLVETASLIGMLYVFAFIVLYLIFDGKIINRQLHKALITSPDGKLLLATGLFVVATLARIIVFQLPLLSQSAASTYLNQVFKTDAVLLSVILFIICLSAVEAFAQVRRRADLKYFLVSGVTLLVSYHWWWAVFVYRGH